MAQLFANNAYGALAGAINGAATTLVLASGNGARFPSITGGDYFLATLIGLDANGVESTWEIVKCTARSTDQLTVVRAQEGTTATSWNAGTRIEIRWTAAGIATKEEAGTASAAIASHLAAADPHSQYTTAAEASAAAPVQSVAGKTGAVTLTKSDVGLGNVDNTTDMNKPISTAVQTALDGKQATGSYVTTADSRLTDSRVPTGTAGGVLSGTYPNPGFAVDMATQAELDAVATAKANVTHAHAITDVTGLQTSLNSKNLTYSEIAFPVDGVLNFGAGVKALSITSEPGGMMVLYDITGVPDGEYRYIFVNAPNTFGAIFLLPNSATYEVAPGVGMDAISWGQYLVVLGTSSKAVILWRGQSNASIESSFSFREPLITYGTTTQYLRGDKSWQTLTKNTVGLNNVDNTSDLDKPISFAVQAALNDKTFSCVDVTYDPSSSGEHALAFGWFAPMPKVMNVVGIVGSPMQPLNYIYGCPDGETKFIFVNCGLKLIVNTVHDDPLNSNISLGLSLLGSTLEITNGDCIAIRGTESGVTIIGHYFSRHSAITFTNKTIALGSNSVSGTLAQFNTAVTDANLASLAGTETLTNKTIALGSNTVSGTLAQFNAAVTDADLASLAGTETLTNKTITGTRETKVSMGANNISLSSGNFFTKTISGATTLTVSSVPAAGTSSSFILDLTNGGSAVITWWAGVKWAGGTAPTLTAAGRDVLGFFTHDGGTTWTGLLLGKDVK